MRAARRVRGVVACESLADLRLVANLDQSERQGVFKHAIRRLPGRLEQRRHRLLVADSSQRFGPRRADSVPTAP